MNIKRPHCSGFTLLEVIVTVVIATIAMTALLPLLDHVFMRSFAPRASLNAGLELHAAMEQLVALNTNTLNGVSAQIGPENGQFSGQTVLHNRYVVFVGNSEQITGPGPLLKVTLQNPLGEQVTRLFSEVQ